MAAHYQRREWRRTAYVDGLAALNRQRQIISLTAPILTPSAEAPPRLPDEVGELAEAKLDAHSSREMRRLLQQWVTARTRFFRLVMDLQAAKLESTAVSQTAQALGISHREAAGGRASGEIWKELGEVRAELTGDAPGEGILGAITAQVRKELGYKD